MRWWFLTLAVWLALGSMAADGQPRGNGPSGGACWPLLGAGDRGRSCGMGEPGGSWASPWLFEAVRVAPVPATSHAGRVLVWSEPGAAAPRAAPDFSIVDPAAGQASPTVASEDGAAAKLLSGVDLSRGSGLSPILPEASLLVVRPGEGSAPAEGGPGPIRPGAAGAALALASLAAAALVARRRRRAR